MYVLENQLPQNPGRERLCLDMIPIREIYVLENPRLHIDEEGD
jgi:hypothetical protein